MFKYLHVLNKAEQNKEKSLEQTNNLDIFIEKQFPDKFTHCHR